MIFAPHRDPHCPIDPMPGRIVVKPEIGDGTMSRMSSGLWIVTSEKERPTTAPIVAIGDDTDDNALGFTFELGDMVLFSIHAGMKVKFGERGKDEYIILKASEIIGRIVETALTPEIEHDKD